MKQTLVGFSAGVALVFSIAALVISVVIAERSSPVHTSAHVAYELSQDAAHIRADEERLGELKPVTTKVGHITECLPELDSEINGLAAEVTGGSVFLEQHARISSYCSKLLTGT
jgi:hypothetical protein